MSLTKLTSSQVTYKHGGTGSETRSLVDKLRDSVSIMEFIPSGTNTSSTDCSAYILAALNTGKPITFPEGSYKVSTKVSYTGKVTIFGYDATILSDIRWLEVTDGSYSVVAGLRMQNITTPYTIQRDYTTWPAQTDADVTQKNTGYIPTGNDTDFWSSLSPALQSQGISPSIRFKSSSATANKGVVIKDITARFGFVELIGYQESLVTGCNIQGGFGIAVYFHNGVDIDTDGVTSLGFTLARGYGNQVIGNRITTPSYSGISLLGCDYSVVSGNYVQGAGESGIKTGQKDGVTWDVGAVCYFCVISDNVCIESRYDGIDASSTYATTPIEACFNTVSNNVAKNNRSTGIFADAGLVTLEGNYVAENGAWGIACGGDNAKIIGNHLVNNVKVPGVMGAINSYDLVSSGVNSVITGNTIFRGNAPAYTYATYITSAQIYSENYCTHTYYVHPSIKGIDYSASSTSTGTVESSLMKYYEEGQFTPTIKFGGGATGITLSFPYGTYTRIGNMVNVTISFVVTNKGSPTGALTIHTLPFVCNSNNPDVYCGVASNGNLGATAQDVPFVYKGTDYIQFLGTTDANVAIGQAIRISIFYRA